MSDPTGKLSNMTGYEHCPRCGRNLPPNRRPLAALMLHLIKDHHLDMPASWAPTKKS